MAEVLAESDTQRGGEAAVNAFRQNLGPFVVAAEKTRMPIVFANEEPGHPVIFANDAFLSLTGYAREEVLGKSFQSLLAVGVDAETMPIVEAAFRGESNEPEIHYRRKDESEFWASMFVSPVYDESGTVVQQFVSLVDLTKHRQDNARFKMLIDELNHREEETHATQAALVAREAELHALNETLEERVMLRTAALAAEQASRQEVKEELRELNRDLDMRVNERTSRLRDSNERMQLLEQITHAIGQRLDVDSIIRFVVRTLQDRLPAEFVCFCRYDRVSGTLTVSHIGTDNVSPNHLGILELAEIPVDRSGLSRCVAGYLVYEPDIREVRFPFTDRLSQQGLNSLVLAPMMIEGAAFGVLVVARSKDNDFLSVDCEFLRQLGVHVGLAAHQSQLRDSLQQAYDDLKQSQQMVLERERLRAIGQMASGIAHDINNAISPVSIYNQLVLEREVDLPPTVREHLELVGRVVKDISATVVRLREFYRPDDAAAELKLVDLNLLVPQVVELTRARWSDMPQRRGTVIRVSTTLETDLPPIMGNASELREAMTNLIFNAVDAMPEGGTITIRTETLLPAVDAKASVRLEIGDTGVGMNEKTRTRCLEAFFTTKGERGTGLGLAMVQHAAQRHKARLDIITKPGAGTRMRLDFFAADEGKTGKVSAPPPRETRPLRLLLIDDDPDVLSSTTFVLGFHGHTITTADGGQAGIDALRDAWDAGERFDVIVTDLGMPYVGGNQVALAAKELFPDTPVVLLTGWGQRMTTGDQNPAHVDYVLSKPADLDELRDVFAQLTDPHRQKVSAA